MVPPPHPIPSHMVIGGIMRYDPVVLSGIPDERPGIDSVGGVNPDRPCVTFIQRVVEFGRSSVKEYQLPGKEESV